LKLILAAKREGPKKLILKSPANPAKAKFGQLKDKYSSPKTEPACKDKPLSKLSDDSKSEKQLNQGFQEQSEPC